MFGLFFGRAFPNLFDIPRHNLLMDNNSGGLTSLFIYHDTACRGTRGVLTGHRYSSRYVSQLFFGEGAKRVQVGGEGR